MQVMECIRKRRSVRKYLAVPVDWEKIGIILDAGRLSPSAGNIQDWQFLVVLDEDKRKQISEACLNQAWMADAPIHIIICSITEHSKQFYGLRGERLYSIQNCAAAAENMLLAATSLGLGSCWIGAFDEDIVKRVCRIPDRARPQIILTIGYADEEPEEPSRRTLENVTFLNIYGENAGRIRDIDFTLGDTSGMVHEAAQKSANLAKKIQDRLLKRRR